jgi:3-methylfumaryl-CoA hydratase
MPAALTALRYTSNTTQPSSELKELVTEWSKQIASERVVEVDTITPTAFVSMSLTLGRPLEESTAEWPNLDAETPPITTLEPPIGTPLPPNWHLIYFPPRLTEAQLASDGYETKWQPPPPFNRRVWAGGRLRWWWPESALRVGDRVRQETRCTAVETKRSAYGDMALVWTEKLLQTERGLAVRDERCIAYLPELSHESGSARPIRNTKIIKRK